MNDLAPALMEKLRSDNWTAYMQDGLLTANKQSITAKWLLGSRRVNHHLQIRFDEATRCLVLQESTKEIVFGIPPPAFTFVATKQRGLEATEDRVDSGVGGGGALRYGEIRNWLKQQSALQGWTFKLTVGKP